MKFHLILGLGLFVAAPASAFEGELWATMSSGTEVKMHMFFNKKGDVRLDSDVQGAPQGRGNVRVIMPAKGDKYYVVSDKDKTVMEARYSAMPRNNKSQDSKPANIEIKKLGTEKVGGVKAQHIQIIDKDDGGVTDMWLAPSYPYDLLTRAARGGQQARGMGFANKQAEAEMKKHGIKPGLIMKMTFTEPGRPPAKFEIDKIQKKKVAASTFVPPKNYKRTQMPNVDMSNFKVPKTPEEAEKLRQQIMKQYQQ